MSGRAPASSGSRSPRCATATARSRAACCSSRTSRAVRRAERELARGRGALPHRVRGGADRHGHGHARRPLPAREPRRCARSPATAPSSCCRPPVDAITHPDDVATGVAGRADLVAGRDRRSTAPRSATCTPTATRSGCRCTRRWCATPTATRSHILGQIQDITDRRRFEERLQHLVDHDPLTGLFNRRRFEQELDRHVAHVERYGAERRAARARPRRLQERQRHARPPRRRRADRRGRPACCRCAAARLGRRSPASAATSSRSCCRAGGADEAEAVAAKLVPRGARGGHRGRHAPRAADHHQRRRRAVRRRRR